MKCLGLPVFFILILTTSSGCLPKPEVKVKGTSTASTLMDPSGSKQEPLAPQNIPTQIGGIELFSTQLEKLFFIDKDKTTAPWVHHAPLATLSTKWRNFWGGGCDFYSITFWTSQWYAYDDPARVCNWPTHSAPTGVISVISLGARINACEYFTNDQSLLDSFFSKGIVKDQKFNKTNAEAAFKVFYPHLSFTDKIYDNFMGTSTAEYPQILNDDQLRWKLYLSTLCQSLYWEIF